VPITTRALHAPLGRARRDKKGCAGPLLAVVARVCPLGRAFRVEARTSEAPAPYVFLRLPKQSHLASLLPRVRRAWRRSGSRHAAPSPSTKPRPGPGPSAAARPACSSPPAPPPAPAYLQPAS
jgi:hypothetical protein